MKYYLSFVLVMVLLISCKNEKKVEINETTVEATTYNEATIYDISVEELRKNKEKYNNKIVSLKGEVTKYNPAILDVNWIHIKDGTSFNGKSDVTATSTTAVKMGDTINIEGKVTLNKNFGSGYVYDIIIENATIIE
jgi:hypothetical protein